MNYLITDIAFGGNGVSKLSNGCVVFVPFTIPGEEVEVSNIVNKKTYSTAHLVSVTKASKNRIKPACKYYAICGGCQYMHMNYETEVSYKEKQLRNVLRRIGKIENDINVEVIPCSKDLHYRNSLSLQKYNDSLGFYSTDNKKIVNIDKCLLAQENINNFINKNRLELLKLKPKKITIKTDGNNISFMENSAVLKQKIGEDEFYFDYKMFFQVNTEILSKIILTIKENLDKSDCLFDLYSGMGIYSICFKDYFSNIIGIEENSRAVFFANKNKSKTDKIKFFNAKVEDRFHEIYQSNKGKNNVVILNPPRIGVNKKVIETLAFSRGISKIIYISCDAATLARDIARLKTKKDFVLDKVFLFDMFPRTKFFESLAIFTVLN